MNKFIQLKEHLANNVYVINPNNIIVFNEDLRWGGTLIRMQDSVQLHVRESVEEIIAKINGVNDD